LAGTDGLCALIPNEPHYLRPVLPFGLFGPQRYVKENLSPALYLPFQLGLKGVPLAQSEAIDHLLCGFSARRRRITCKVSYLYLAAGVLSCPASFFFLFGHEKHFLPATKHLP